MRLKYIIILTVITIMISCDQNNNKVTGNNAELQKTSQKGVLLILPASLESRRDEFLLNIKNALSNIGSFSEINGWKELCVEDFMDSVMIFDKKEKFNETLLNLTNTDKSVKLPDTYCAALENRTLLAVTPEYYSKVYPEGIENKSFEKLITHEIAHRLHIRILNGDEEAMGPIWFYEGFAMYAANQFTDSDVVLTKKEIIDLMNDPERGSYKKYSYIFRYFVGKIPLKELVSKAKNKDFNEELIKKIK
jgi:hypothetical protein